MNDLCTAAHNYAGLGWRVFPCVPLGKKPHGLLARHGLKDASTDHELIDHWWRANPEANIGLVTGEHFDALDIDGDDGHNSLVVAMPEAAPVFDGPTVLTGGGGFHLYVEPTGLGNKAGFIPHCDWRGQGGYVIAPPSVHASGQRYQWWPSAEDPWSGPGAPLQAVPRWLHELMVRPKPLAVWPQVARRPDEGDAYGRAALESEVAKIVVAPEGVRNHTLNAASYSLGQLMAVGALDPYEAKDALVAAALRAGLGENEAKATIASGIKAGLENPRELSA